MMSYLAVIFWEGEVTEYIRRLCFNLEQFSNIGG